MKKLILCMSMMATMASAQDVFLRGNIVMTLNQFSTNMQQIVQKIKADGKVPVVMNNYTRGDFTLDDYSYVKQMNLLIHQWDVASVNTLGAIDDGTGKWATGYQQALPDLQPRRLRLHQDGMDATRIYEFDLW